MTANQKIEHSSSGDEVLFRPQKSVRIGQTITQLIWVLMAGALLFWSWPAILAYFQDGEIIGAARQLDRFDLSARGFLAAMIGWCVFIVWFGLGGLYEIVKVHIQRDRFILRPDSLIVRKSAFLTREITLNIYEQFALRVRAGMGVLEARTKSGWQTLTIYGTVEDRTWLLQLLQNRYRAPADLPVTEVSKESKGTFIVERTPDGRLKIESSKASTIGCAAMAAVLCVVFVVFAILSVVKGSGSGLILIFFAFGIALGGLSALNKRTIEASRGRLRVQWSSPAGKIASRFLSKDNFFLKYEFGEGSYTRETGFLKLKTSYSGKNNTPQESLVLLRERDATQLELEMISPDLQWEEDLILKVHGHGKEETTRELLQLIAETTGFPVGEVLWCQATRDAAKS